MIVVQPPLFSFTDASGSPLSSSLPLLSNEDPGGASLKATDSDDFIERTLLVSLALRSSTKRAEAALHAAKTSRESTTRHRASVERHFDSSVVEASRAHKSVKAKADKNKRILSEILSSAQEMERIAINAELRCSEALSLLVEAAGQIGR